MHARRSSRATFRGFRLKNYRLQNRLENAQNKGSSKKERESPPPQKNRYEYRNTNASNPSILQKEENPFADAIQYNCRKSKRGSLMNGREDKTQSDTSNKTTIPTQKGCRGPTFQQTAAEEVESCGTGKPNFTRITWCRTKSAIIQIIEPGKTKRETESYVIHKVKANGDK